MPKATGLWSYLTKSEIPELDGKFGEFTCVGESQAGREGDVEGYPVWWSDVLDKESAELEHKGAKTVNRWREQFLRDFQSRLDRCIRKDGITNENCNS